MFFEQAEVALLRSVADAGEEEGEVVFQSLVDIFFYERFEAGCLGEHFYEVCLCDDQEGAGLNRLQVKEAGAARPEAFYGGDALVLEEELEGDVFSVVVEPEAQAALVDIVGLSGDLVFAGTCISVKESLKAPQLGSKWGLLSMSIRPKGIIAF